MSALSKLEALRQKQAALAAQIRAEQTAITKKQRADDASRERIVGAVVQAHALKNPETARWLAKLLNQNVTKDADRELLGALLIPPPPAPPVAVPAVNGTMQQAAAETANPAEAEKSFENIFNQPRSA
jgi:hypothetical protein